MKDAILCDDSFTKMTNEIIELYKQGFTLDEITEKLDISINVTKSVIEGWVGVRDILIHLDENDYDIERLIDTITYFFRIGCGRDDALKFYAVYELLDRDEKGNDAMTVDENKFAYDGPEKTEALQKEADSILYFYKCGHSFAAITKLLGCSRKRVADVVAEYLITAQYLRDIYDSDNCKVLEWIVYISKLGKSPSDILRFYGVLSSSEVETKEGDDGK